MIAATARRLRVRRVLNAPPLRVPAIFGAASLVLQQARSMRATPVVGLGVAAGTGRELWDENVDHWVDVPTELPDDAYLALKIVGNSMAPLMHTGDTVLIRLGHDIRPDTVVIARHPDDGYVCKRVRRVTKDEVALASIDRAHGSITIARDPTLVLGTVVMVWCHHAP